MMSCSGHATKLFLIIQFTLDSELKIRCLLFATHWVWILIRFIVYCMNLPLYIIVCAYNLMTVSLLLPLLWRVCHVQKVISPRPSWFARKFDNDTSPILDWNTNKNEKKEKTDGFASVVTSDYCAVYVLNDKIRLNKPICRFCLSVVRDILFRSRWDWTQRSARMEKFIVRIASQNI